MKKTAHISGFTIIEVILVLTITSLMIVGAMVGVSSSVTRQRYNDAVQDFGEYLRSVYSKSMMVQNSRTGGISSFRSCTLPIQARMSSGAAVDTNYGENKYLGYPGRTECAVYGKLITFGEEGADNKVHEYDVIGTAVNSNSKLYDMFDVNKESNTNDDSSVETVGIMNALKFVGADVVSIVSSDNESKARCDVVPAGNHQVYAPQWGISIKDINNSRFTGSLLIVRSPVTGAIHTFFREDVIEIQRAYKANENIVISCDAAAEVNDALMTLGDFISDNKFAVSEVNFCLDSEDVFYLGSRRRNIRVTADGNNASAIELVDLDSEDNLCP